MLKDATHDYNLVLDTQEYKDIKDFIRTDAYYDSDGARIDFRDPFKYYFYNISNPSVNSLTFSSGFFLSKELIILQPKPHSKAHCLPERETPFISK